ncbi:GntR family transcriptional regulator [Ornithinimicrobium panacihumi]|uniref:GntR family transcriptional regulator n=1 Tax=Ornithinimicrobium panacihumi TaxID=2008449 RepID=UPI003F889E5B
MGKSRAEQPEYQRVAAAIRRGIRENRWEEGKPLPTDAELERQFHVSRQTVRRAYLDLVGEGLVYRVPGRGTFATPSYLRYRRPFETVDDLLSLSQDTELEIVEPLAGAFEARAAGELRLESRLMYGVQFLRRHNGTVFCYTSVHLPPAVGSLIENVETFTTRGARTTETVIGALASHGVQIAGAEQSMTAIAAGPATAELLGCPPGHPLLHAERLYLDPAGRPVEWAVSDFLPEHYTHRLHLGRRPATTPEGP